MKFTKTNRKARHNRKLVLLFFQIPNEIILSSIREYLKYYQYSQFEYFCDQKIPLTFPYAGKVEQFSSSFDNNPTDELIIIGYPPGSEISQELLLSLKLSGIIIKLIPVDLSLFSGLMCIDNIRDLPHITLFPDRTKVIQRILKEVLNKVIALIGIIFSGFFLPFIALFIKITSSGPVFYKQTRLGKNARPFTLYKFRTMGVSAEKNGPQLSGSDDSRITRAGKILRYWHIDEFPQFWNILKGDMALVGSRPERPFFARFLAQEIPYYKIVYQQKPGLTSLGMIKYGYATSIEEMMDRLYYDIIYLNNPTFWMDIKILINTLRYIIHKAFYDPSKEKNTPKEENVKPILAGWSPTKSDVSKTRSCLNTLDRVIYQH
ncbi:sugar transferase [Marinilabilia rubra]|uniref:Polyprenyl glycosylphosphotransferase n=1 Tax=Marinilabilia rubra TaxID=2162893 RepID=A0A2U2B7C7_9BACT|nr:sugar transferase [Marinilabilia rubra]PWD98968.1 polyprenyl glycosylphosphotransferase [Marinilabilia rubra]